MVCVNDRERVWLNRVEIKVRAWVSIQISAKDRVRIVIQVSVQHTYQGLVQA